MNHSSRLFRCITALAAGIALQACSPSQLADGAFRAFLRACDPNTIHTETTDLQSGARTFSATCKPVQR